jgi:hypothetical protein
LIPPFPNHTPVTFETYPGRFYLPAQEAASALGWAYSFDSVTQLAKVGAHAVEPTWPRLWDGSYLIPSDVLVRWGAVQSPQGLKVGSHLLTLRQGVKRVVVHLGAQSISAYEGSREVMRCAVSTGGPGKATPTGHFRLGLKDPHHVSSIYGSPMPWAVHVTGGIYVHGSEWFSDTPASHGCIRLEMHGDVNWAEWFYDWSKPGTPITIER